MDNIFDVIIIGGGPAGLSAGLYASRAKLRTLIIEKSKWGGQAATTEELENYPGSIEHPTGPKLTERMRVQAESFGAELIKNEVLDIDLSQNIKTLKLKDSEVKARTVIIATGAVPMTLNVPKEAELRGRGVSYCATCDADFFTDLEVVVAGGGDAAVEEAVYLTKYAEKVTIIHRRNEFRAAKSIVAKAIENNKIDIIWDTVIEEILGDEIVEGVRIKNLKTNEVTDFRADGVFVFVGTKPISDFIKNAVDTDEKGYIITDEEMKTSKEGVFCAGDVRQKTLRQVITAAADGAIAAISAEKYILQSK